MPQQPQLMDAERDPFGQLLLHALRQFNDEDQAQKTSLQFHRQRSDGSWSIEQGSRRIAVDELAIGAAAARHLCALHARKLFYAGPTTGNLCWRGFAVTAAVLDCQVRHLQEVQAAEPQSGIFADGAAAEQKACAFARQQHLQIPADISLIGISDGRLPEPMMPGLTRLRIDPMQIARAMWQLCDHEHADNDILIAPGSLISRDHGGHSEPRLQIALSYINAHLHQAIDVDMLAKAAGMPRRSLERLFRRTLGHSPLDEIQQQRITRAQELMRFSDLRLQDIAGRVGFSNADRLRLVFKKICGMTPQQWRQQQAL